MIISSRNDKIFLEGIVLNKYYVYVWYNEKTNEIIYVGKGSGKRYKDKNRNPKFKAYVNKYKCSSRIILDNLNEVEAFEKEIEYIKYYRQLNQAKCNFLSMVATQSTT